MNDENSFEFEPDEELIEEYIIETSEILQTLDQDLVQLEETPEEEEVLNSVFRGFHTIKGTSSSLGFENVANLSHKAEELLDDARNQQLTLGSGHMDLLLETIDTMRTLLDSIESGSEQTANT